MTLSLPQTLFIPRTSSTITSNQIKNVISNLKLGTIKRIDLVKHYNQQEYQKIFIHFEKWAENQRTLFIKQRFEEGKDVKIIYDPKTLFFWKITPYKCPYNN
jgi:hypothetical protein